MMMMMSDRREPSAVERTVMTLSDEGIGKACSKRNLIEVSIAESIFERQVIYVDIILLCLNIGKNHIRLLYIFYNVKNRLDLILFY